MKNLRIPIILSLLIPVASCTPKVSTTLSNKYPPLDYAADVTVIGLDEKEPDNAEFLGQVKIGDTGFSTDCDYDVVIDKAKTEARKVGGNAIKIVEHIPPSVMGSSCHRITARILRVTYSGGQVVTGKKETVPGVDYAVLNVYRYGGAGALVSYDLHLGDAVICRVTNRFKTTLHINKLGRNSLWAKTESKAEIPVDLKPGRTYYVKCGITMGLLVGRPSLELVDEKTGKSEFDSLKTRQR